MIKEINGMTNKKIKKLYQALWGKNKFVEFLKVRKTPYKGSVSDNSYMFDIPGYSAKDKSAGLNKIFAFSNKERFCCKFAEACSGDGQEGARITTLHSSSLCALLFFYDVNAANPMTLKLDGNNIVFTDSFFEFKNTVIEGRNPSNIDVVLLGKQGDKKVILFLESKFSEYQQGVESGLDISKSYLDNQVVSSAIYNDARFESLLGITRGTAKSEDEFRICSSKTMYLAGIKQMISHYVGIYNFMSGKTKAKYNECQQKVKEYYNRETTVYLGTVVFDYKIGELTIGRENEKCLESYEKKYEILADIINKRNEIGSRFKMLSHIIRYSDVSKASDHKFDDNVIKFYFG